MDRENSVMMGGRGNDGRWRRSVKGPWMLMEGDVTWGAEHTVQHTDDVPENCAPETCV